ncbi:uncharacterized protein HMPREF1541_06096 [Cyphellophora europaea CBS 101466]|uniref:Amino acid permease n=1 Tax=Cyphellophora europaea (strain CBS 101466) TaxID=1220924 RepID=W2RUA9_CYPE1|nr:uncharacterized protein HMPREF1541_06096 [Cyphellophora europaea CBS 101466]ETN39870.1 hypothetical protein HMPREF1541_06096 [Cyphellophora europaea CBS 101466]
MGGTFQNAFNAGGPVTLSFGWIGVTLCALCVAGSLAEMCSSMPTNGGQYSWTGMLSTEKWAPITSWITGWIQLVGVLALGSTGLLFAAQYIMGIAVILNPSYTSERWQMVLVMYMIAILITLVNIYAVKILPYLTTASLVWSVVGFLVTIIVLLVVTPEKNSAKYVFTSYVNYSGYTENGIAVIIGLLQSFWGMLCYDAPAHMAEEMHNPAVDAPRAMITTVIVGGITGWVFLISVLFCVGDIESVLGTATGVPFVQIWYDSTISDAGIIVLGLFQIICASLAALMLLTEGSRTVHAFARDHGLPFSATWSQVSPRLNVPVHAILLSIAVQCVLCAIYFGTTTGFYALTSVATIGFYVSYLMPILVLLIRGRHVLKPGPFTLGRLGLPANLISVTFLTFGIIFFCIPSGVPVTAASMNYTIVVLSAVAIISAASWFMGGNKAYVPPRELGIHHGIHHHT